MVAVIFCTDQSRHVNYSVSNRHWTSNSRPLQWIHAQNKFTFNCWSCHAFNVVHQLSRFCALYFATFADEVVLLIFVLQTFSWNHSPIYFVCSTLSSLETFRNICVTLCCKKKTARHRTLFEIFPIVLLSQTSNFPYSLKNLSPVWKCFRWRILHFH